MLRKNYYTEPKTLLNILGLCNNTKKTGEKLFLYCVTDRVDTPSVLLKKLRSALKMAKVKKQGNKLGYALAIPSKDELDELYKAKPEFNLCILCPAI